MTKEDLEFIDIINNMPPTENLIYKNIQVWLHYNQRNCFVCGTKGDETTIKSKDTDDFLFKYGKGFQELLHTPVYSIASFAFRDNNNLKEFICGKMTGEIREGAFYDCKNLERIFIPKKNFRKIQKDAFWGCKNLKTIFYEGSKEDWDKIRIERSVLERKYFGEKDYTDVSRDSNIEVINAKIIFNCLEELKNENER